MPKWFLKLRNFLQTKWESHPWDTQYKVRRGDIRPGLKIIVWLYNFQPTGLPEISRDSELKDAIENREKYKWFGVGKIGVGIVTMLSLTFTTSPYQKDGHWHAKAVEKKTGQESEYSLFELGIVPDYILRPQSNGYNVAGWKPDTKPQFDSD